MKKILCILCLMSFSLAGCMPTVNQEENTGLKEYIIYDKKAKVDYFSPLSFKTKAFTSEEINQFSTIENVYPYYRLDGRSMPYTQNDNSFWDLYINNELSYTDASYNLANNHMRFPYDIQPYYNENTIKSNILSRYVGDPQNDLLKIYASDVLMNNLNLSYNSDFSTSYVIDYKINCPIYNADKQNHFDYKMISLKAQIIGVVKASDGYSTAYLKYEDMMEIIKENNGENTVPTDTYLLVTDNKAITNKVKKLNIDRELIVESREW